MKVIREEKGRRKSLGAGVGGVNSIKKGKREVENTKVGMRAVKSTTGE